MLINSLDEIIMSEEEERQDIIWRRVFEKKNGEYHKVSEMATHKAERYAIEQPDEDLELLFCAVKEIKEPEQEAYGELTIIMEFFVDRAEQDEFFILQTVRVENDNKIEKTLDVVDAKEALATYLNWKGRDFEMLEDQEKKEYFFQYADTDVEKVLTQGL